MNKRYERRSDKSGDNKAVVQDGAPEEIVTGVPATEDAPVGTTQFSAFEAAERKASETARLGATAEPVENRDNRGAMEGKGKRISISEIDVIATEWARERSQHVERVSSSASGDTLTVNVTTRHGTASSSAEVDTWSEAGVKKALKEIGEKMDGKRSASDEPRDKLAEAVREVAKKG